MSACRIRCVMCDAVFNSESAEPVAISPNRDHVFCPDCGRINALIPTESPHGPSRELWYTYVIPYPESRAWPKCPGLVEPFLTFEASVLQLESMRRLPMEIGWIARLWQRLKDEEMLERFNALDPPTTLEGDDAIAFNNALWSRVSRWFKDNDADAQNRFATRYGPTVIQDFGDRP